MSVCIKCLICVYILSGVLCDLCRRKASVDENYEWDAADFCSQPGDHDGEGFFFLLVKMQLRFWHKYWWKNKIHLSV